jgi:hypothetical protein
MDNNFKQDLLRTMSEHNETEEYKAFNDWCEDLLSQPSDLELRPQDGFEVDIEVQPLRWLSLGIDLIESRKVIGRVQLVDGIEGPEITSYLPYPVFQMATEIFLKGMWLYQFDECRCLTHRSYIDRETRRRRFEDLKNLGHDLIKIIEQIRNIPEYAGSEAALKFLDLVERTLRRYYFPPHQVDKDRRWADARYPKRVYNDVAQQSQAESFKSYPPAKWVAKLFRQMKRDVDQIWRAQGLVPPRR